MRIQPAVPGFESTIAMKNQSHRRHICSSLLATLLFLGPATARTWTSADGAKTFEGELLSYQSASGAVKVRRADGRSLTFKQSHLSPADIEFLKQHGDKTEQPAGRSGSSSAKAVPDELPKPDGKEADVSKPVKVFILMGQSNMLGFGKIGEDGQEGSLTHAVKSKKLYPHLIDDEGNWTVRKDVRNVFVMEKGGMNVQNNDWLTIGGKNIGPEIQIGHVMGELFEEPVLLLKSCIGNRSLGWDLLPPGSESYKHDGKMMPGYGETEDTAGTGKRGDGWYAGKQYDDDIRNAKEVLKDLDSYYPGAKKYEVAGFFWWQGDKDRYSAAHASRYEQNLVQLIKQLRVEFEAPEAKFVCATLGQTKKGDGGNDGDILKAMFAVDGKNGKHPEFKGNVATVYSHPLSKGGASNSHYGGNAETYMDIGEGMGRAMADLFLGK
jgi:hypothetical protein